jgi:hypothetical protein
MPERIRLLVCGGRRFDNVAKLWGLLDGIAMRHGIACVIEGAQQHALPDGTIVGADYWAHQWALARDYSSERYHADWDGLGRSAGPTRNRRMLEEGRPTHAVATRGGKGTAHMVSLLKEAGVPVWEDAA